MKVELKPPAAEWRAKRMQKRGNWPITDWLNSLASVCGRQAGKWNEEREGQSLSSTMLCGAFSLVDQPVECAGGFRRERRGELRVRRRSGNGNPVRAETGA